MSKRVIEDTAMGKAAKGFGKIIAVIIILAVAILGDVMYIVEMQKVFPSGLLLMFCYLGAFTSFLAIGYLLLGKSVAFRPGGQMLAAWVVFGMELAIIALNIILAFNPDHTGFLGVWAYISPATPVLHMLGVALIYFMDPDLKSKHDAMEMQEKMDKSERNVEYETFNARIALRRRQVEHVSKALEQAVNSPESLAYIQQFGYTLNRELLTELTGMSLLPSPGTPGLPAPGSSSAPVSRVVSSSSAPDEMSNEQWRNQVNDRMASERARRLQEDVASADGVGDEPQTDLEYDIKRLSRIAEAASAKGYGLSDLEDLLGVSRDSSLDRATRLARLASAAQAKGYSLDRLDQYLGFASLNGGDNPKKK